MTTIFCIKSCRSNTVEIMIDIVEGCWLWCLYTIWDKIHTSPQVFFTWSHENNNLFVMVDFSSIEWICTLIVEFFFTLHCAHLSQTELLTLSLLTWNSSQMGLLSASPSLGGSPSRSRHWQNDKFMVNMFIESLLTSECILYKATFSLQLPSIYWLVKWMWWPWFPIYVLCRHSKT